MRFPLVKRWIMPQVQVVHPVKLVSHIIFLRGVAADPAVDLLFLRNQSILRGSPDVAKSALKLVVKGNKFFAGLATGHVLPAHKLQENP
ncbi:unnamed protein product [Linum trigynum]|uniref:Uncharacterized protein n=1 Tax=Linum trigynum TaxID=586398 RepID=A0AAV2FB96_9ROSI